MVSRWTVIGAIVVFCFICDLSFACRREPKNIPHGIKTPGDNGYHIYIGDEENGYLPGKIYNGKCYLNLFPFLLLSC